MKILIENTIIDLNQLVPGKIAWEGGKVEDSLVLGWKLHIFRHYEVDTAYEVLSCPEFEDGFVYSQVKDLSLVKKGKKFNTQSFGFWKLLNDTGTITGGEMYSLITHHLGMVGGGGKGVSGPLLEHFPDLFEIITGLIYRDSSGKDVSSEILFYMMRYFLLHSCTDIARKLLVHSEERGAAIKELHKLVLYTRNCRSVEGSRQDIDGDWLVDKLTEYALDYEADPLAQAVCFIVPNEHRLLATKDILGYVEHHNLDFGECVALAFEKNYPLRDYVGFLSYYFVRELPLNILTELLDSKHLKEFVRENVCRSAVDTIQDLHTESLSKEQIKHIYEVSVEVECESYVGAPFLKRYIDLDKE